MEDYKKIQHMFLVERTVSGRLSGYGSVKILSQIHFIRQ